MAISYECEGCGKPYKVADQYAGKLAMCKQCGAKMRIPVKLGSDDLGLDMLASKSPAPPPLLPRTTYQPAPNPRQADRPKLKPKQGKAKAGSGSLYGSGGYSGDHLRHLVWIGIVVAFFLFRVFVRTSIRNDLREAAEQRRAQAVP